MCLSLCKKNADAGILLIRLGLAAVFIGHGFQKVTGMAMVVGFFSQLGLPAFVAYLVAFGEIAAGLAMLLGFWTHWAGKVIAIIMLGAIALAKFKTGFLGGYELDLMLLLSALGITFMGPGAYSLEAKMAKKSTGTPAA